MSSTFLKSALSCKGVKWIGFGWMAFIAENREAIIDAVGDDNYHIAYSTLSTLACGSIGYGYIRHGKGLGPMLAKPGPIRQFTAFGLQSLGLVGLSQLMPEVRMPYTYESVGGDTTVPNTPTEPVQKKAWRCPMDFRPRDMPEDGIVGMDRVSRHSMFWSLGFVCLGRAVTAIYAPEVVMFGFPSIFALIGGAHQDHRFLKNSGGKLSVDKYEKTSNVPFWAVVNGKQKLSDIANEMKVSNMCIALCLGGLFALKRIR